MRTQENFSFVYCERSNSRDLGEVLQGLLGSTPETARDFDACLLSEKNQVESQVTFGGKPLDDAHRTLTSFPGIRNRA